MTPPDQEQTGGPGGPGGPIDARLSDALERVGHVLRTRLRATGAEHRLSPIQAQLLLRIASVDQSGREPARLADWFDVSRPTVSDATGTLCRKGLLTSQPVPGDRRRTRLALTPDGRRVAEQLAGWDEPVRAALATLAPSAKGDAIDLLLDLIALMQQAGLVTVARTCTTCRFYRPPHEHDSAGHCTLLDAALPPESLRLDCPEHDPAA